MVALITWIVFHRRCARVLHAISVKLRVGTIFHLGVGKIRIFSPAANWKIAIFSHVEIEPSHDPLPAPRNGNCRDLFATHGNRKMRHVATTTANAPVNLSPTNLNRKSSRLSGLRLYYVHLPEKILWREHCYVIRLSLAISKNQKISTSCKYVCIDITQKINYPWTRSIIMSKNASH